jgi:transposase-like protein
MGEAKPSRSKRKRITKQQIIEALNLEHGRIMATAQRLGVGYGTLKKRIKELGIESEIEKAGAKVTEAAATNVAKAIFNGDLQLSKWWLLNHKTAKSYGFGKDSLGDLITQAQDENSEAPSITIKLPNKSDSETESEE